MQLELLLVGGELAFAFCSSSANLAAASRSPGLQIRLGLASSFLTCARFAWHLAGDPLDQAAILLEAVAPFLELLHGAVVFVLHLRDRIGLPEDVRDLVHLRAKRGPELSQNQAVPSFLVPKSNVSFYYYEASVKSVPLSFKQLE